MEELRPGQYKRIGRIAETNPERAKKVANRMEDRAENRKESLNKRKAQADEFIMKSESKLNRESQGKKVLRPDTPLAATPPPITDENRDERLYNATRRNDLGPKIINLFKKNK